MRKKLSLGVRLLLFAVGILISSFGVALSAKSALGITPISSPPYVMSLFLPLSMGTITTMLHILLVIAQILILRRRYNPKDLLQIVLGIVYGYVMDLSTALLSGLVLDTYIARLAVCVLSVFVIGFGVYLTAVSDIMFLAGEGLVSAITKVTGKEFGRIKIFVDSGLLVFAAVISLIAFHGLRGIREGTFIAAIGVGLTVQIYGKIFPRIFRRIVAVTPEEVEAASGHLVVTVAREFDPWSMDIVRRLSELTGMKLYDDELIDMVAEEYGVPPEVIRRQEDRLRKGLLQTLYGTFDYRSQIEVDQKRLFEAQKRVILRLASKEDCIIVGRNANRILGKGPNYFHIYLHAKPSRRVERTAEKFNIREDQAAEIIMKADEQRVKNYSMNLGRAWGYASDYNLCLDVTHCNIDRTATMLKFAIEDFTWKGTGEEFVPA